MWGSRSKSNLLVHKSNPKPNPSFFQKIKVAGSVLRAFRDNKPSESVPVSDASPTTLPNPEKETDASPKVSVNPVTNSSENQVKNPSENALKISAEKAAKNWSEIAAKNASDDAVKNSSENNATKILSENVTMKNSSENVVKQPGSTKISIPGAEKKVVVYLTSLRVVRTTFEDCRAVQSILRGFRIKVDERDLSMDSSFLAELERILGHYYGKSKMTLPRVFIGGRYIGGADEVITLHETGELKKIVKGLPAAAPGVCEVCGGYRFILCEECDGSHKCYTEGDDGGDGGFRMCTVCNENGLVRCPLCACEPLPNI